MTFSEEILVSCFASIGAAICYSLSGIFVIHFFKNKSLIALSFMSLMSAFVILTPINYITLDEFPEFPIEGLYSLAILGVFCTGLAYLLYFQVLKFLVLRPHPVLRILFLCSACLGCSILEKSLHGK